LGIIRVSLGNKKGGLNPPEKNIPLSMWRGVRPASRSLGAGSGDVFIIL